jgi:hypothetical protein
VKFVSTQSITQFTNIALIGKLQFGKVFSLSVYQFVAEIAKNALLFSITLGSLRLQRFIEVRVLFLTKYHLSKARRSAGLCAKRTIRLRDESDGAAFSVSSSAKADDPIIAVLRLKRETAAYCMPRLRGA